MFLLPEQHNFTRVYCAKCGDEHIIIKPCGARFCPACGHISRWRVRERLHQLFKLMRHERGYRLKMLTLATKNCQNLEEGIDDLIASFRRLRQRKLWNQSIRGGIFVIEISGSPGSWHPHLHCFIYSLRIQWESLRDLWSSCSKGGQSVWIANISNNRAIYYVTKYVTKPGSDPEYAWTISQAMKGRRTFQRFGTFQKIKLPRYASGRECEVCGSNDWLTEWDLRKAGLPVPGG